MNDRILCLIFGCILTLTSLGTCLAQSNATDSVTITTYYPAPYGVYKNMRLYPSQQPGGTAVLRGTLYFNGTTNQTYYYNGSAWVPFNFFQSIFLNPNAAKPPDQKGQIYYNFATNQPEYFDGSTWKPFGTGTGGAAICGNGVCETEKEESCQTCIADCPTCVSPNMGKTCPMNVVASYNAGVQGQDLAPACDDYCKSKKWCRKSISGSISYGVTCGYATKDYLTYRVNFNFDDCSATKTGTALYSSYVSYCRNDSIATCNCKVCESGSM
ncbi:MAG: hypothetical protein PHT59_02240 [Candidatus Omnitrophica bacterium]|nr:hypothetical protein [Candidatus Omnitrophota bacterium]